MPVQMTNIVNIVAEHRAIKQKYPASIVLIKVDNLYQAFDNDAHLLHKILRLPLMNSDEKDSASIKVEFLTTALDDNLATLLKGGYKVAVCSYRFAVPNSAIKNKT